MYTCYTAKGVGLTALELGPPLLCLASDMCCWPCHLCRRHSNPPLQGSRRSVLILLDAFDCSKPSLEFVWLQVFSFPAKHRWFESLGGGNLAGPGSAIVPVGGSGSGGGGSDRAGGSLALLDLEGLSGVSGMNVQGSDCSLCSLEGALVGV